MLPARHTSLTAMAASKAKSFRARLELVRDYMNWTVVRVPFDVAKTWPEMQRRRVKGTLNGVSFRTSLLRIAKGEGDCIVVYKKMQREAQVKPDDEVAIRLEPDLEEREEILPEEFGQILKAEPELRRWFQSKLSPSDRSWIGQFIGQAKSAETRKRRAEEMAERLMLTMEGELETPPILKLAFQRQPVAERGWRAMTEVQRRRHLLGIFNCRTPETREKRVRAVMEQAIAVAQRTRTSHPGGKDKDAARMGHPARAEKRPDRHKNT
ncbi:YdeI/OmpD-associated family protein [Terracidiphilus sp.]|uniref:YdeI/OmpD-associated family protein n=1 Tax=Terracidiphilus sp. TaxID=1964191 RepID=UPI003C2A1FAC